MIPKGALTVDMFISCKQCGSKRCTFWVDPPYTQETVDTAIKLQKRYIAKSHHSHEYEVEVKTFAYVPEVSNA